MVAITLEFLTQAKIAQKKSTGIPINTVSKPIATHQYLEMLQSLLIFYNFFNTDRFYLGVH